MRHAPAFSIDIPAQPGWRRLVNALIATSVIAAAAWWLLPASVVAAELRFGLALASLLTLGLAWPASRTAPCRLRWDGVDWWHGDLPGDDTRMRAGQLRVTMGLSLLLLLRFEARVGAGRQRVRWIPVLPSGLETQWHALRCAVYSARPSTGHPATGALPNPASPRPEPPE